jgi:NAD(P)-dependent dehydrogenase (short-subunit alcohol dehydrogenase family)
MFRLDGQLILLTGATGHLGTAMALGLAAAGAETILVGRKQEPLDALCRAIEEQHQTAAHALPADLDSDEDVAGLTDRLGERFAELHGLINNAYSGRVGPVPSIRGDDFAAAARLNLAAPFLLAQALAPLLRAGAVARDNSSSIVNIGSMYGKVSPVPAVYGATGLNNPAHYGATKAGLLQLTRYLACNLDPAHIRVNSVSPGAFPDRSKTSPEFIREIEARVPLGRIGEPPEIVGSVIFLLSDAASYVNGADLAVDGGWTAW